MYIEIPSVCPCPSTSYVPYISSVKTGRAKYLLGFTKVEDKCNIIEERLCIIQIHIKQYSLQRLLCGILNLLAVSESVNLGYCCLIKLTCFLFILSQKIDKKRVFYLLSLIEKVIKRAFLCVSLKLKTKKKQSGTFRMAFNPGISILRK